MNTYFLIVVPFVLLAEVILLPQVRLDYTGPTILLSSGVLCTEYTSLCISYSHCRTTVSLPSPTIQHL